MKTHIRNMSGLGTICKTSNRVVAVTKTEFKKLDKKYQCLKCLAKVK